MALIKCPECGREISDKAQSCIYCGLPLKEYFQDTQSNINNNFINISYEINKVIEKFESYRIRKASFFYKTSKFTYDAFYTDISAELIHEVLNRNEENLNEYEAIDFVVESTVKIEELCVHPQNYTYYEKYIVEIGNLMKNNRYNFFSFGCWMFWLKSLNYDRINNDTLMSIAKIISKGNFTAWTKGELNILFSRLTYSEKVECMKYWGEKYNSNIENNNKINSEALYNCWLEYKNRGQVFNHNEINNYRGTDTGNIILPEVSVKKDVEPNIPKCPTCQSTNIKKISGLSKAGSVFMWGVFAVGRTSKQWHCNNCGSEW